MDYRFAMMMAAHFNTPIYNSLHNLKISNNAESRSRINEVLKQQAQVQGTSAIAMVLSSRSLFR
jgi:hypothetical protein